MNKYHKEDEEKVLSPEEVSGDGFGHTEWVQPSRDNDLNRTVIGDKTVDHVWIQYGNEAICESNTHDRHGMFINPMEMIVKKEGGYVIEPVPQLR